MRETLRTGGDEPRPWAHHVAYLTAVRYASLGAGFVVSLVSARILGSGGMGAVAVSLTIASIAALLFNGGLNIAAIFFLGKHRDHRAVVTRRLLTMGIVATLLGAVGVVMAGPWIDTAIAPFPLALMLTTAALAGGILAFELSGSVLLGLGGQGSYIGVATIEALAILPLAVVAVALVRAPEAYIGATAASYFVAAAVAVVLTRREIGPIRPTFNARFAGTALQLGLRGQAGNILQFLNLRLDMLLVPVFVDLPAAGIYLVAVRVSEMVAQVASATATLLFPRVAQQQDLRATAETEKATRSTLLVVVVLGAIVAVAAGPLLGMVFGPQFATGTRALQLTMMAMLPLSLTRILAGDLKGRGRAGLVSISAFIALVVTIMGNLALIPALGIEGAAVASLLAYTAGLIAMLIAYRRVTGAELRRLVPTIEDVRRLLRYAMTVTRRVKPA